MTPFDRAAPHQNSYSHARSLAQDACECQAVVIDACRMALQNVSTLDRNALAELPTTEAPQRNFVPPMRTVVEEIAVESMVFATTQSSP